MRRLSVVQMVTSYNSGCSQRYLPQLATETDVERFTRLSGAINKDYH